MTPMWCFQVMFSSIITPRNFRAFTLSIVTLLIFKTGRFEGKLAFVLGLWNKTNFVFLVFKDSLFSWDHKLIFVSSLLSVSNNVTMFCESKTSLCHQQT